MLIVIAVGGHALNEPGACNETTPMSGLAKGLGEVARGHRIVITHGSGPQIGDMAMHAALLGRPAGFDGLCAELQGRLGYELAQSLGPDLRMATVITRAVVDPNDLRLAEPCKPIGPVLDADAAGDLSRQFGWSMGADRGGLRRLIASPMPHEILEIGAIRSLVDAGFSVVCAGGGGIPVTREANGRLKGLDAVIDKDHSSALIAIALGADALIFLTDVEAVRADWPPPKGFWLHRSTPTVLRTMQFSAGSMRPKIEAATRFVEESSGFCAIGRPEDLHSLVERRAGTIVEQDNATGPGAALNPTNPG